jgi:hypothetical protein
MPTNNYFQIRHVLHTMFIILLLTACGRGPAPDGPSATVIGDKVVTEAIEALITLHGEEHRARIERGVSQSASLWREEDGDNERFLAFCREHFIAEQDELDKTFARFEHNIMLISGYLTELRRDLNIPLHLDTGPILPVDALFGQFSPAVHMLDDMFNTKLAFVAVLNFPFSTLNERIEQGQEWSRRQWAETRLAQRFEARVPSSALQQATSAYSAADNYINSYNIHMYRVLDEAGQRLFPEGKVLISHWGLRDELKAQYAEADGLPRQRMIMRIMDRILRQEIPAAVINNPDLDWYVEANTVAPADAPASEAKAAEREQDTRYSIWKNIFLGERAVDTWTPLTPTHIARRFDRGREMTEETVEELLVSVLSSPLIADVAERIRTRLGRDLEAFDIWYPGFKARPALSEADLDNIVRRRYPTPQAFEADIPNILRKLGFNPVMAAFIADRIGVDASRGAGHAMGAGRLSDKARLRTRISPTGMDYKGYNIAMHELGHNVEQVLSFQNIDHTLLRGVPNVAFTEGFAFVFQSRDLEVLGLRGGDATAESSAVLDVLWSTYEISGVALVDMRAWRWLYDNPDATPTQFRDAVIDIAKDVWNSYYAPVFGMKDIPLLAIYSHLVKVGLYTPDYPLGHIIAFQIEQYLKGRNLATEMTRMCAVGNVTPDLWMVTAVGQPISTAPLLDAAKTALQITQ